MIEKVKTEDAEELLAIYAPYVKDTAISFEYEVPAVEEFRERIRQIESKALRKLSHPTRIRELKDFL